MHAATLCFRPGRWAAFRRRPASHAVDILDLHVRKPACRQHRSDCSPAGRGAGMDSSFARPANSHPDCHQSCAHHNLHAVLSHGQPCQSPSFAIVSGRGTLRGAALAIALMVGGLAGWLLGAHPLLAHHSFRQSGAGTPPASHRLPRMIVPSAFSPDGEQEMGPCDQTDMGAGPMIRDLQWVTCYGAETPESAAAQPRDPASPSMAVFRP